MSQTNGSTQVPTSNDAIVATLRDDEVLRLKAEIARLTREAEEREERAEKALRLAIGEKGGVSVYGLAGFPVTLYAYQWYRLFLFVDAIKAFMVKEWASLKFATKDGKPTPKRAAKVAEYLGITDEQLLKS